MHRVCAGSMRYHEMSIQEISCSKEQCEDLYPRDCNGRWSWCTVVSLSICICCSTKALISAVTLDKRPEPGFLVMLWVSAYLFKNKIRFHEYTIYFRPSVHYILLELCSLCEQEIRFEDSNSCNTPSSSTEARGRI